VTPLCSLHCTISNYLHNTSRMSSVSGMAAAIRAATENEQFDLGGNAVSTIQNTIKSAFATPLDLTEMIRITFVTGAGKLGRQKYDDDAAKTVTSTLRDLGYTEDRGASCVVECAGSFKSQHDTGKNLKTIVVFPLIQSLADGMDGLDLKDKGPAVLDEGKQLIAMASKSTFERMMQSKCVSWSQKKECLLVIGDIKAALEDLDAKLMSGTPLTDSEQEFYDTCELSSLENKEAYLKSEMQKEVEEGKITSNEKKKLLNQVMEKMHVLEEEIADATKNKKPKKLEKLTMQKQKLNEREKTLERISPCAPHPLKHQPDIEKLRKEMQPLLKLEKETKGRLLSLKETTTLARKDEIDEEILYLEVSERNEYSPLRIYSNTIICKTRVSTFYILAG